MAATGTESEQEETGWGVLLRGAGTRAARRGGESGGRGFHAALVDPVSRSVRILIRT